MTPAVGKVGKVMYGAIKVAGMGTFTLSGYEAQILEKTEFGDTIQKFVFGGAANPGTVEFSGLLDPTDTNGQRAIDTACTAETPLTNLYFYISATKYWAVDAGGEILITKCKSGALDKNGLGTTTFAGKVSGAAMSLYGT